VNCNCRATTVLTAKVYSKYQGLTWIVALEEGGILKLLWSCKNQYVEMPDTTLHDDEDAWCTQQSGPLKLLRAENSSLPKNPNDKNSKSVQEGECWKD
jgi:hypothetical protein